jgi:hypothetical protein
VWSADDGYLGKDRPQYLDITEDEIADCETKEDVLTLLADMVKEDFDQRVGPEWDGSEEAKILQAWERIKGGRNSGLK